MRETTVFLGLTRPSKFFGLPIAYFICLMLGALIPFVGLDEWKFMLLIPVCYPVLWLIADRNPNLFEILATVYTATPPTKNRTKRGADSYTQLLSPANKNIADIIGEDALKDESAAKHLPYLSKLADNVIITRQGDLMASAVVEGLDSFTSDERDVDNQVEAFARQVGQFGEEFGFYINKVTVPEDLSIKPAEEDAFTNLVDRRWSEGLEKQNLKKRVIVLSLCIRPAITEKFGLLKMLRPKAEKTALRADLAERMARLNEAMRLLENMHSATGFRRLTLADGEWLGLLACIQGQQYSPRHAMAGQFLATAAFNSTVSFDDRVIVIDNGQTRRFAAIFGVQSYSPKTWPTMLDDLELPYDIVVTNSFSPNRNNAVVEKMKLVYRQMKATDDAAESQREELLESADNVASGRQSYGVHHLSIMVVADSREELEDAASDVWRAGQETAATLIRERAFYGAVKGNASALYFAQAPCNWSHRIRTALVSSDNFAELGAFHKARRGRGSNETPWGEIISFFPTVTSSAYQFNFHDKGQRREEPSAGHTLVLGRTGSGKTLGTAFLIAQARRVGARVIVFDKDLGLEMAVRAMGGSYSEIKMGQATGFNPFLTETDERGAAWLTDWLTDILGRERPLSTVQSVALTNAVRQIVDAEEELRNFAGLESLVTATDDQGDLVARVREWSAKGRFGWIFGQQAEQQIHMGEEIVGLDMSEILDSDTERSALLAYLFRRVERVIEDRHPTLIVIDEAWKMLNDPIFVKRLHDWLVTMRKKNCVVAMLTQTPSHLEKSDVGQIIAESVTTQILYPNARANPEDYKILRLNPNEAAFLCNGSGGSRIALVRSGSDSVFVNMDLSPLGGALQVLGGGRTGEDKAPHAWRENKNFWKEMV